MGEGKDKVKHDGGRDLEHLQERHIDGEGEMVAKRQDVSHVLHLSKDSHLEVFVQAGKITQSCRQV